MKLILIDKHWKKAGGNKFDNKNEYISLNKNNLFFCSAFYKIKVIYSNCHFQLFLIYKIIIIVKVFYCSVSRFPQRTFCKLFPTPNKAKKQISLNLFF